MAEGWHKTERPSGELVSDVHESVGRALEAYRKYEDCLCHYLFHPMEDEVADTGISRDAIWPVKGVPIELADVVIQAAALLAHKGEELYGIPVDIPSTIAPNRGPEFGEFIAICHAYLTCSLFASARAEHPVCCPIVLLPTGFSWAD